MSYNTAQKKEEEFSLLRDGDQLLPDIPALEEPDQRRGRPLEPLGHILDVRDPPFLQMLHHHVLELPVAAPVVVEHYEPFDSQPLRHHAEQVVHALVLLAVVLRDHSACRNPAVVPHVEEHGVEHRAAHVLEVYVDAARKAPSGGERCYPKDRYV